MIYFLTMSHFLSVTWSCKVEYCIYRQPRQVVQRLILSNHKAQSEVWNIAGWSNGSRARCEDKWQPQPIIDDATLAPVRVMSEHWDHRHLNILNKAWVNLFLKCGFWMGLECGAWWREECYGWSDYLSLLSSHIPHFHEIRLQGECNEGAITYFWMNWTKNEPRCKNYVMRF